MKKLVSALAAVALLTGGAVAVSPAASASCNGVTLYYQGGLTGSYANVGINESRGMKLAIDKYNNDGPKTRVTYAEIDTQADKKQSPALAAKVVKDPCAVGVVGGMYSGETIAAVPVYADGGVPVISPSATNPALSGMSKYFHRVVANDLVQGPALAKIALGVPNARIFVVDDATDYGKGLATIVRSKAKAKIVGNDSVTDTTTNFSTVVAKVKKTKANVVVYPGYFDTADHFVTQLRDNPATRNVVFVAGDGVLDAEFVRLAKKNAEGARLTAPFIPMATASPALAKEYKAKFKAEPGVYTLETYNAANIFLEAIAQGATTRAAIQGYINGGTFEGVGMTTTFDEKTGDTKNLFINEFTVKNGKIVFVREVYRP